MAAAGDKTSPPHSKYTFDVGTRYTIGKKVAEGTYGVVVCAVDEHSKSHPLDCGLQVAIKKITLRSGSQYHLKTIVRECTLLTKLNHENILHCQDIILKSVEDILSEVYIVMPYMDTTLDYLISCKPGFTDSEVQIPFYLTQLMRGLKYLDSVHVIHRDLKPGNILVQLPNHVLKICDFGMSRVILETDILLTPKGIGTYAYMSPEVLVRNQCYTAAVDVFSAGLIFLHMIRGQIIKERNNIKMLHLLVKMIGPQRLDDLRWIEDIEQVKKIIALRFEKTEWSVLCPNTGVDALDLLKKMLTFNPDKRISAHGALNHPFLKKELKAGDENMLLDFPVLIEDATNACGTQQLCSVLQGLAKIDRRKDQPKPAPMTEVVQPITSEVASVAGLMNPNEQAAPVEAIVHDWERTLADSPPHSCDTSCCGPLIKAFTALRK